LAEWSESAEGQGSDREVEVTGFVMTADMRTKLDKIFGSAKVEKTAKVDGRTTRTWTKAQKRAIAKRLAAGKAAKVAAAK